LVEFLSAADVGRAERASKENHPFSLVTLRKRALFRFPSHYRLNGGRPGDPTLGELYWILVRYPALRVLDASTFGREELHSLLCGFEKALPVLESYLPHLREIRVPAGYASAARHMICQEHQHITVAPALDPAVEQLMAAAYACGDKDDNYPWNVDVTRDDNATEPLGEPRSIQRSPDGYARFQFNGDYSAKLLDVRASNKAIYYDASIRTPENEIAVSWRDCTAPVDAIEIVEAFSDEFYEAFGDEIDYSSNEFVNLYDECLESLVNEGREWFEQAPFEMMFAFVTSRRFDGEVTIVEPRAS